MLLLAALLGQSGAVALPSSCVSAGGTPEMPAAAAQEASHHHQQLSGKRSDTDNGTAAAQVDQDCCDSAKDSGCSMGGCASVALPGCLSTSTISNNEVHRAFSSLAPPQAPFIPLFRPPIA
jgi:hypothetical protein